MDFENLDYCANCGRELLQSEKNENIDLCEDCQILQDEIDSEV